MEPREPETDKEGADIDEWSEAPGMLPVDFKPAGTVEASVPVETETEPEVKDPVAVELCPKVVWSPDVVESFRPR